ncbi:glycosyl hydrolase 115 family protein [Falsirhodobacter deserti]|uniref:glycosyl hydrolase 115 family protein n=1 Tax=Falsirhodobacter deserti TaxID=1365611 RepID=UPI000FE41614|nr:glycosyl hydrolase 115 family protein [Falsirhodobacter deserti]
MTLNHADFKAEPFTLDRHTVLSAPQGLPKPVQGALGMFARDFLKVFGSALTIGASDTAQILVRYDDSDLLEAPETFSVTFVDGTLVLTGKDDLGIIYGLLHLSRTVLGFDPFWFWTGIEPGRQDRIRIEPADYVSSPHRVPFRGWFVNDEVCLIGWTDKYPPPAEVWEPVFETLLRLGGNLVIPGTDLPRNGVQTRVAADMGLYLTHHHAEPLGSEMFFRAHPEAEASFDCNGPMFEALWQEAIERQRDDKIVWTLGFRGQGDCPFWEQDPAYDTPERQGELISRVIRRQHEMLQAMIPGAPCLTYVYGEIAELYRAGHIEFPPGVAKIWSDNGYGRMVSRRQHNHSLRVPSLPGPEEDGPHGIYYHATFHDLQASSHLTMLPVATGLLVDELQAAFDAGADDILLVNCGNIRPHIYTLEIIARLWRGEEADAETAPIDFASNHFPAAPKEVAASLRRHIDAAIAYGPFKDDRAGDEFYHHPARSLVGHVMRGETGRSANDLLWATGDVPFRKQVTWFEALAAPAAERYAALERVCEEVESLLPGEQARFFRDLLSFQTRFHRTGAEGLTCLCRSITSFLDGKHPQAFVWASRALWAYEQSLAAMTASEHGKWKNFFRADWLTNVRITIYTVQALRMFYRMFGDNPDYFLWHKEYLMPDSEKKIYLENTHRNPPTDDDLARRLGAHFGI